MRNSPDSNYPQVGKSIYLKERAYTVKECLCDGVFSSVYLVEEKATQRTYAMKLERQQGCERPVLKLDISVLREMSGTSGFTALVDAGRTRHFKFLVMQRVGPSLADLQRKMPEKKFSPPTVYRIGLQSLERILSLHSRGWLNRDIKAANFAVGIASDSHTIYMLDFGLARRYRKPNGTYFGVRGRGPCVGTWPFCPLVSNAGLDQMPIHDLEGWFYFIVYIYKGSLPWFKAPPLSCNTYCRDWKQFVRGAGRKVLLDGLPREWHAIFHAITRKNYFERPDYGMYTHQLRQSATRKGINLQAPFDWEKYDPLRALVALPPVGCSFMPAISFPTSVLPPLTLASSTSQVPVSLNTNPCCSPPTLSATQVSAASIAPTPSLSPGAASNDRLTTQPSDTSPLDEKIDFEQQQNRKALPIAS